MWSQCMSRVPREVIMQQKNVPAGRHHSFGGTNGAAVLSESVLDVNPRSNVSGREPTTSVDRKQVK